MTPDITKENITLIKTKKWRRTIDDLIASNGTSLREVCDYIGSAYNEHGVSFYAKLPKKRTTYIGIGMAFHQPLEVINTWITEFAFKKKLYIKDISEDLIWIYLITVNSKDPDSGINFFQRYEECQSVAYAAYSEVWEEVSSGIQNTTSLEIMLDKAEHDEGFTDLIHFIKKNIDSFKTAYSRPRKYLNDYLEGIFRAGFQGRASRFRNLNSMRGYLDDSMINYLSGDHSTINTYDWKNRTKTLNIKYVPKSRKFHISLCLALGMTASEINHYLDLMGYAPLTDENATEKLLIELLNQWDISHPLNHVFKKNLISGRQNKSSFASANRLTYYDYTNFQQSLLFLREEMYNGFKEHNVRFPYMRK